MAQEDNPTVLPEPLVLELLNLHRKFLLDSVELLDKHMGHAAERVLNKNSELATDVSRETIVNPDVGGSNVSSRASIRQPIPR